MGARAHACRSAEDRDHMQGAADAPVTLVEYGDYECPYCGAAYPIVKEVQAAMGERLRFVFRNFPLTEVASRTPSRPPRPPRRRTRRAEFWPMHDLLYENQERLADEDLRAYADALGLDVDAVRQGAGRACPRRARPRRLHERRAERRQRDPDVLHQRRRHDDSPDSRRCSPHWNAPPRKRRGKLRRSFGAEARPRHPSYRNGRNTKEAVTWTESPSTSRLQRLRRSRISCSAEPWVGAREVMSTFNFGHQNAASIQNIGGRRD